jgi:hypothetical protein
MRGSVPNIDHLEKMQEWRLALYDPLMSPQSSMSHALIVESTHQLSGQRQNECNSEIKRESCVYDYIMCARYS